jgi:hypothetical protein
LKGKSDRVLRRPKLRGFDHRSTRQMCPLEIGRERHAQN